MRGFRPFLLVACVLALGGTPAVLARTDGPAITHGIVVGDVRAESAVLWVRGAGAGRLHVGLSGGAHRAIPAVDLATGHDFTGQVDLTGLRPETRYRYRAWVTGPGNGADRGPEVTGSFRTAPAANDDQAVRLVFGGDISGQNVCRDAAEGIPIAATVQRLEPDVFVGLGDMIYADDACLATGRYGNAQLPRAQTQATDLPGYWAHWRYNRADPKLEGLLASTGYVGVWDDHEVVNDFGPQTDTRATPPYDPAAHLMPLGRQAFEDYTPLTQDPADANRLYRSIRSGAHLELIVLDTRQYRDANSAIDDPAHPKSMLGAAQLAWLKSTLASSTATWKVVVSSVPMSIPTGFPATNGRDGWANFDQATGFEHELLGILRFAQQHGVGGLFWITTDVHFAEAFRYVPFADAPDFVVYELVTGPMNAGIFPSQQFDPTLQPERLTFYGPPTPEAVTTWEQARGWFNVGLLDIGEDGTLTASIVNTAGERPFTLELEP
jgi:alkaline phosphatase D